MRAGCLIINDFGSVQIDEDAETYVFHSKGTQTLNGRAYDQLSQYPSSIRSPTQYVWVNTDGANNPPGFGPEGGMLAFRPRQGTDTYAGVGWRPDGSMGLIGYQSNISAGPMLVDWWYFVRPSPSVHGFGMELLKEDGTVAFTTAGKPMKLVAVSNDSPTSVNVPYAGNWALSVGTPFPANGDYIYGSDSQFRYQERGLFFQVNSTFVSTNAQIMGCRSSYDTGQFMTGRNPVATQLLIDVSRV